MLRKIYTLIFLTFLLGKINIAQSGIYKTLEDYKNGTITEVGEYAHIRFTHVKGKREYYVVFKKGKEKVKYSHRDIWGYRDDKNRDEIGYNLDIKWNVLTAD